MHNIYFFYQFPVASKSYLPICSPFCSIAGILFRIYFFSSVFFKVIYFSCSDAASQVQRKRAGGFRGQFFSEG